MCRRIALALLLVTLASLAGATSALAFTFPYTFTPIAGSPFSEDYFPQHALFSPDGGLLATSSSYGFAVQPVSTTGSVGPSAGGENAKTCPSKGKPSTSMQWGSLAFSPDSKVIAAVAEEREIKGVLRTYSVSKTGATTLDQCLTNIGRSGPPPGDLEYSDAFSPAAAGGLLAVSDAHENKLWVFTVTGAGKVYPLKGSPFATGKEPRSVAFSQGGSSFDFLATANAGDSTVSVWTVGAGAVAPVPGSPFASGAAAASVAFSPSGAFLASADVTAAQVSMFSVGFTGKLTPVSGSPFATGHEPRSVAFSPDGALLATAGPLGRVGYYGNEVSLFSVASDGKLTQLSNSPLKTGSGPDSVAFSPDGFLLATANQNGNTTSVFSYAQQFVVALPPWLSARIGTIISSLGLASEETGIKGLIGQALEEVHWGSSLKVATVHLVSQSTLPGREVAGRCVKATQGSPRDPRCSRTGKVAVLTFVAHSASHTVRVLKRHRLTPGSHPLLITATAPAVSSTPQALQVTVSAG